MPPTDSSPPRDDTAATERLAALKKAVAKDYRKAQRKARRQAARSRPRALGLPWYLSLLWWLGFLVLPFLVLVRVSVWGYAAWGLATWLALAAGVALTLLVVAALAARASAALTGKARFRLMATRVALPLTLAYGGYALLYLSSANAKSDTVRSYYTSLHPIMRLALSTAVVFDGDLVVTDLHRVPADYVAMGLPVYEASLHFRQADGYVHAADLRTISRPGWRNWTLRTYFRVMGFRTVRHVGTADHLHVSLPLRE